jgi:hypothetical protein
MAIYLTPYDTTAGLGYRYTQIAHELRTALTGKGLAIYSAVDGQHSHPVHGMAASDSVKHQIALVQGGNSFADAVHFFKHPVLVRSGDVEYICVDVREFGKWNEPQQRFDVRNITEFVWAIKRALLTAIWNDGRVEVIRDISNLPAQVYCALMSESISRRFALDPSEQAGIAIIAGYFFYGLFAKNEQISEEDKNMLAGKIARNTHLDASFVFDNIDGLGPLRDVQAFCDCVRANVGNVALENLNAGILLSIVGGNWWGTNARETLNMGLEHIPTWTMIVEASLSSATYKRSTLAKLTARFDKRGAGPAFQQSLDVLLGGPDAVEGLEIYKNHFGDA